MRKLLVYLALPATLLACEGGTDNESKKQALQTEVMDLHDEAMADMGKIYRLRRNLTTLRDLAQASPDTAQANLLTRQIVALNRADEAMMDWMRHYQAPDSLSHEQAMHYLQQEHTKMANVKALMDSTIAQAKETYTHYGPK